MKSPDPLRTAFSLTELLIVVTIISILMSLGMVMISMVRTNAKVLRCASNLRQLGVMTLLRAQDHKYIWASCVDYNNWGIQADRLQRFRNDDPASRLGAWSSAQTDHQLNLPELIDFFDGGASQFNKNNVLQCPASQYVTDLTQPPDVNNYWYKQFGMTYVYTDWVSKWWDAGTNSVPTNDSSRFCDRTGGGEQLLWSDIIFRWTGGTSNGHPQAPWGINHSPQTQTQNWYGVPPIVTSNQCFGDGRVVTKRKGDFQADAMEAMSDDPTKVLYVRSAGTFNDRRFF